MGGPSGEVQGGDQGEEGPSHVLFVGLGDPVAGPGEAGNPSSIAPNAKSASTCLIDSFRVCLKALEYAS